LSQWDEEFLGVIGRCVDESIGFNTGWMESCPNITVETSAHGTCETLMSKISFENETRSFGNLNQSPLGDTIFEGDDECQGHVLWLSFPPHKAEVIDV
jgi:hypothetical protein